MTSRRKIRRAERQRRQLARKRWITVLLSLAVAFLGAASFLLWIDWRSTSAAFDYAAEDVSHDQPFTAVHEMGEGPAIPFLPRGEAQPKILLSERFHNFGQIESDDIVTTEFLIANVGEAPLTISRAYTTCGCTTAEFSGSVILPGMVSIVTVRLDAGAHDVRGQTVRRGVIIENSDPARSSVEFWLQATVR
jgi:hypothetical protein